MAVLTGNRTGDHRALAQIKIFFFYLMAYALISLGFAQVSQAGVISTGEMLQQEIRHSEQQRIADFLAREDVAAQLAAHGVSAEAVMARVGNLTASEISALEGRIGEQVAGGDAIAIIGTVFLVLLILELVGVTDIFKAI
jgi:hypothetical protein